MKKPRKQRSARYHEQGYCQTITPCRRITISRMEVTQHIAETIEEVFHLRYRALPERYRAQYDEIVEMSLVYLLIRSTGAKMVIGWETIPTKEDFVEKWYLFAMRYNEWHLTGHTEQEDMEEDLYRIQQAVEEYLLHLCDYLLDIDTYFGSGYEIIEVSYRRYAIDIDIIGDYRVYVYHRERSS